MMLNYDQLGDFFQGMMDTFMPHKPAAPEPPDDPLPETPVLPPLGEDEDRDEEEPESDEALVERVNKLAREILDIKQRQSELELDITRNTLEAIRRLGLT